jgi:molecular chaperone GrpE
MGRTNGKSEIEPQELDAEHELPAAEDGEDDSQTAEAVSAGAGEAAAPQNELQKLKSERVTLLDRLARMQADFENSKKRAAQEQQKFRDYVLEDAVKSLLPILDSFERALQSDPAQKSEFHAGVELIYKQLLDALNKLGVAPVVAKGEPFDPYFHQAIEMVETNEVEDQHVVEELQRGYKLKDRLLRPSMVKVARNSKH